MKRHLLQILVCREREFRPFESIRNLTTFYSNPMWVENILTLCKEEKDTVRLGSRCRSVFKTREFRFDYLTNMVDGIEKMSFVCWHFLASRILAEISSVKNTNKNAL